MGPNLTKGEKLIAVISLMVIAAFFGLFLFVNKGTKIDSNFDIGTLINYKMARPEQAYSEYTLEGRELEHTYEGLEEKAGGRNLSKRKQELIAKNQSETKKKEELKKKETAKAQSQAKARKEQLAVAKKNQQLKQQELAKTKTDTTKKPSQQNENRQEETYFANNNEASPDAGVVTPQAKPKKSFAEWRNQIFSSQSSDSIGQFIGAYRKSEVTATELQAMAQDLLDQNDVKLKGLGLMLLRAVPSLASLSQLVHEQPSLPATYQTYVDQSLLAYFYPQNLGYISQALATRDRTVVVKVLNILNTNLLKLSQGDASGFSDQRSARDGSPNTITMNSFRALIPVLGQLSGSQDAELAQLAQNITGLIQSSNNIAQN